MIFEKVKQAALEKGMSIAQIEKEAGIGNGTIRRWDESNPRIDKLQAVSKILNKPIEFFLE